MYSLTMFAQCYNSLVCLAINKTAYAVSMEPDFMSVAQFQPIIHTWETGRMEVLSVGPDQKGQYQMIPSHRCHLGAGCCVLTALYRGFTDLSGFPPARERRGKVVCVFIRINERTSILTHPHLNVITMRALLT
ncbi:hypothetical protein ED236_07505 [Pseudomethylobacillus aquaticus]|uniref:Uncharacterized protein n=1 Tax=Pseudomethylobacillus aquaticus TaxID=2676064 RepID=A0A3N0V147_9PROT|nr:hypothetical protein ED236_07505 [Pseudomethylobacillus aquaticus]